MYTEKDARHVQCHLHHLKSKRLLALMKPSDFDETLSHILRKRMDFKFSC